jgi:hypothetical protein
VRFESPEDADGLEPRTGLAALVVAGSVSGATVVVDGLFAGLRGAGLAAGRGFAPVDEQPAGVTAALLLGVLEARFVREPFIGMHVGVVVLDVGGVVTADVVVVVDAAATVVVGGVVAVTVSVPIAGAVLGVVGVVGAVVVAGVAPAGAVTAARAPSAAVAPPTHVVNTVDIASVLARTDSRGRPTPRLRSVRKPRSMHVESRRRA